jgi:hypothetical protein
VIQARGAGMLEFYHQKWTECLNLRHFSSL